MRKREALEQARDVVRLMRAFGPMGLRVTREKAIRRGRRKKGKTKRDIMRALKKREKMKE